MQPELLALLPESFSIILARHAAPDRTRYDIPYYTVPGPELTEKGRQEAVELGEFLRDAGTPYIFASPLERTWRTAVIAGEVCGVAPTIDQALAEWRPDEVEKTVVERMRQAFSNRLHLAQTAPVTLVTHGGPAMALLKWLGLPASMIERHRIYDSRNLIPTAGAWRIEKLDGELRMQLAFVPAGVTLPSIVTL